jgi:GNAT superfamily N-acetyltransferase
MMSDKPRAFTIEETSLRDDIERIQRKLLEYNLQFVPPDNHQTLNLLARDPTGGIIGGLLGGTFWGWLRIEILWVTEGYRKQGIGQQLLQGAEHEAIRRGCHASHLETHSFQAVGFYRRRGYEVYGELQDFPCGHTKYFLRKRLSARPLIELAS